MEERREEREDGGDGGETKEKIRGIQGVREGEIVIVEKGESWEGGREKQIEKRERGGHYSIISISRSRNV
jgi:hypothetical protein